VRDCTDGPDSNFSAGDPVGVIGRIDIPQRRRPLPYRGVLSFRTEARRCWSVERREFITLLVGAAAWPLAARSQQMPVMGYLGAVSARWDAARLSALRQSLAEAGYVEGSNLAIEYSWAEGDYDRLPAQAAEFVRRGVAVILAGSLPSALAVKAATTTIPIV